MSKDKLIQYFIGLSYQTGYKQGREDLEREQEFERRLESAYRKGRAAEAAKTGDTKRVADLMGGAE